MKASVLLLLTLPVLLALRHVRKPVPTPTPEEIKNTLNTSSTFQFAETNLKWQVWPGYIPNGSISAYNDYFNRINYLCKHKCDSGFYTPELGPRCFFPSGSDSKKIYFEVLVNKDDFEILEWKNNSNGAFGAHSVKTCLDGTKHVGKGRPGMGTVYDDYFFVHISGLTLPFGVHQTLDVNKDIESEQVFDVQYHTEGVEVLKHPTENLFEYVVNNLNCQPGEQLITLSSKNKAKHRWNTSFSITEAVNPSIVTKVPIMTPAGVEFSSVQTLPFLLQSNYSSPTNLSVTIKLDVPASHSCKVNLLASKLSADIPFTARIKRIYQNGETRWTSLSGTYHGSNTGDLQAVVGICEPLHDSNPCA